MTKRNARFRSLCPRGVVGQWDTKDYILIWTESLVFVLQLCVCVCACVCVEKKVNI